VARFESMINNRALLNVPFPANLGQLLMQSEGFMFGGAKEEDKHKDDNVPIYNITDEVVGHITYQRLDGGKVNVIIVDADNSQGDILTVAAFKAMGEAA
jgi:hypothetical protein